MEKNHKNYPGFIKNLKCYFAEYCQNTSLHGLKFLGEKRRSAIEKFWWIIVIGVSFYFCTILIVNTYHKWQRFPVIVNFATSQTPIWQIPFPAVTICPETKSDNNIFNYTEVYLKKENGSTLTEKEKELYEYLSLICLDREKLQTEFIDEKVLDFITAVAPKLEDSLWLCKWISRYENCTELFIPVITENGVCYSFNILDHSEMFKEDVFQYKGFQSTNKSFGWSPESGYSEDDEFDAYPQRALFSGTNAGLSLTLETASSNIDNLCSAGIQGYKVHLHHPIDIPSIGQNYFTVPLDEGVVVAIKPRVMNTNEKLESYPPDQRKCYFAEEKPLRFFKMYSQQNCHTECLTNFTLATCKCVAFHMPRVNSTPICGAAKKQCMLYAEATFLTNQVSKKIKLLADDIPENDLNVRESCECLPSCTTTDYDGEISQTPWNWKQYYDSQFRERFAKERRIHNSKLILFFKERQIMTSQRSELYGHTDFIANCGGILGLFIGFSFISLVELIYFLTLRFICNLRTYGRHFWAGNFEIAKQK